MLNYFPKIYDYELFYSIYSRLKQDINVQSNQSFKEIWHNNNYKQFRAELMRSRKNIDICSNCSEGVSVWKD